jgi:hypothetical protein
MVGSWVLFLFCGEVRLGYVDSEHGESYWIYEPGCGYHHKKAKRDVALAPDILPQNDRAALIDMALDMKDREWFHSLVDGNVAVAAHDGE